MGWPWFWKPSHVKVVGLSKERRHDLIGTARSLEGLRKLWGALEQQGYSKEGLTYARVLQRRLALGGAIDDDDRERLRAADHALSNPPPAIRGRIKL